MCVVQQAVGVGTNNSYHSSSVDVHRTTVKLITLDIHVKVLKEPVSPLGNYK